MSAVNTAEWLIAIDAHPERVIVAWWWMRPNWN